MCAIPPLRGDAMPLQGQKPSPGSRWLPIALALVGSVVATAASASSSRHQPEAACIAYDLHVLTLIEDHGLVEDTEPEILRQAAFTMLEARSACHSGDVKRSLALYDGIPLDPVPMAPFYRILMR